PQSQPVILMRLRRIRRASTGRPEGAGGSARGVRRRSLSPWPEPLDDDAIRDLFSGLGRITIKRMFGGKGVYHDGLIIALEVDDEILLKADAFSAPEFEAAGSKQWVYAGQIRKGKVAMPYWSIPDSAIDDADEMVDWARKAYAASLRSQKPKKSRRG